VIRFAIALCLALCCACTTPPTPDTKVIVGATLLNPSEPPLPHSVVIIKDDRVAAVGSQQMTPIPPGSSKVEAYGKYVRSSDQGAAVQAGSAANLVIVGGEEPSAQVERRMAGGRWVQ
jgi:hypothetical protein